MDWKYWLVLTPAVIQAVFVVLEFFGVRLKAMQMEGSTVMIMAILMVLTWGAVGIDLYSRSRRLSRAWEMWPMKRIVGKKFTGETVLLDGKEFINCEFNNVTFEFQGKAPTRLLNSRIRRTGKGNPMISLKSSDPVIAHTLLLVTMLNEAAGLTGGPDISEGSE